MESSLAGFVVRPETLRDDGARLRMLLCSDLVVAGEVPRADVLAVFEAAGQEPARLWPYLRTDGLSMIGAPENPYFTALRRNWRGPDFFDGDSPGPAESGLEGLSLYADDNAWTFRPTLATRARLWANAHDALAAGNWWLHPRRIYFDNAWTIVPPRLRELVSQEGYLASIVYLVELARADGFEVLGNVGAHRSVRSVPSLPALPIARFHGVTVEAKHIRADGPAWWLSRFHELARRGCGQNVAWDIRMVLEGVVRSGVTTL